MTILKRNGNCRERSEERKNEDKRLWRKLSNSINYGLDKHYDDQIMPIEFSTIVIKKKKKAVLRRKRKSSKETLRGRKE